MNWAGGPTTPSRSPWPTCGRSTARRRAPASGDGPSTAAAGTAVRPPRRRSRRLAGAGPRPGGALRGGPQRRRRAGRRPDPPSRTPPRLRAVGVRVLGTSTPRTASGPPVPCSPTCAATAAGTAPTASSWTGPPPTGPNCPLPPPGARRPRARLPYRRAQPRHSPRPGYARIADLLVTFEGRWETYRAAAVPEWTARHPPRRFCHLVYAVPEGRARQVARTAVARGAAVHCAVPGDGSNPWRTAPDRDLEGDDR
ncbi:hypothetical protein NKH77_03220 [Streptomyces sp. M19]